jgi:hypothetical protein
LALPRSRNTTYTAASPVLSNDLNSLQDCVIAALHGQIVRKLPVSLGSYSAAAGFSAVQWAPSAHLDDFAMPLAVYGQEQIWQVTAKVSCGATDAFTMQVFRYDPATQTSTQLGATQTSVGHAGATEDLTVAIVESNAAAYNYVALIQCSAFGAGALRLHGVELMVSC